MKHNILGFPIIRSLKPTDREIELIVSRMEVFLLHVWATWQNGKMLRVAPLGAVELDMAAWAAGYDCRETGRGLLAPRGIGKSHIVTVGLSTFRLVRDPDRKVIIISKSLPHAKKAINLMKSWMSEVPVLRHLKPSVGDTQNKQFLDVRGSNSAFQNSVSAYGIESQIPGNRGHTVITDDTETKTNTKSVESRKNLDDQHKDFRSLLYGSGPEDRPLQDWQDPVEIVDVGTRHHETDSVYDKKAARGYAYRTWTLCLPRPDDDILNLAPSIRRMMEQLGARLDWSQLTCPHLFSAQDLAERRAEGDVTFGMQQMLLRTLKDISRFELRLENLMVFAAGRDRAPAQIVWGLHSGQSSTAIEPSEIPSNGLGHDRLHRPVLVSSPVTTDPSTASTRFPPARRRIVPGSHEPYRDGWLPYSAVHAWFDPAGGGADKVGIGVVAACNGMFFWNVFLELEGGHSDANLIVFANLCRDHRVRRVFVEGNNGGDASSRLIEMHLHRLQIPAGSPEAPDGWSASVSVEWATGQKEVRILDELNPVTRNHRLVIHPTVAANPEFQRQYTRLSREKNCLGHEDGLEAGAMCIKTLRNHLGIDPVREEALRRQEHLRAILAEEEQFDDTPRAKRRTRVFLDG